MKNSVRSKKTKEPTTAGRHPSAVDTFREGIVPILRAVKKQGATADAVSERFLRMLGTVYGADAIGSIDPAAKLPNFARRRRRLFRCPLSGEFAKCFDDALAGNDPDQT